MLVRDLMTESPYTLEPSSSLADLYDLMDEKNVRHVPIVEPDGRLAGLASHRDLVKGALHGEGELPISTMRHVLRTYTVAEIMVREPETIDSDANITSAGAMMTENKFGCLPVVDGETLVGILTESDFVRYVTETA